MSSDMTRTRDGGLFQRRGSNFAHSVAAARAASGREG
jgi:hypothetical protein